MTKPCLAMLLAATLSACSPPEKEPAAPAQTTGSTVAPAAAAPGAAPAGAPAAARTLNDAQRAAMLEILNAEAGPEKKVWFAYGPGNPETAGLKEAFESVFKEAGWQTQSQTVTGMILKPGLVMLVGEEQAPPYVDSALKALEASGLEVKSAYGYRGYFEEKRTDPKWVGIPLGPDQAFVFVIGPQATS